jgi:subtilisin family serine protease
LTGPQTTLSAPAVNLLGARHRGYWRVQGTSFAAPLVSGAAALVRSKYRGMNAANVINRLIRTAQDLGPPGRDDRYGYGEVNPLAAVTAEVAPVDNNPLTTHDVTSQTGSGAGSGELRVNGAGAPGAPGGGGPVGAGDVPTGPIAKAQQHTDTSLSATSTSSFLAVVLLMLLVLAWLGRNRYRDLYLQFAQRYVHRGKHAR